MGEYNGGNTSSVDTAAGNTQIRQEWYNKKAIIDIKDDMIFAQFSGTMSQPKHYGKEVVKHRYIPLLDDQNSVANSGIDPDGITLNDGNLYGSSRSIGVINGKLPDIGEDSERVNKVNFSRKEVRGKIKNRGFFFENTKDEMNFDTDAMFKQHITTEAVRGAAQVNEDVLAIELVNKAGVVFNAGTGQDYTLEYDFDLASMVADYTFMEGETILSGTTVYQATVAGNTYTQIGTVIAPAFTDDSAWQVAFDNQNVYDADLKSVDFTGAPTIRDLIRLDTELDNNKCPRDTKVIVGSTFVDTRTVAAARYMFISPDAKMDFMSIVGLNGTDDAFVPVEAYQGATGNKKYIKTIHGEIGKVGPFRIVVHPKMVINEGAGAAWSAGDDSGNGALFRNDGSNYNVYPCLVIGSESFTHIGFEFGAGTAGKFKVTHKTPESLRSRENPYGKFGMTVIEWWNGILVERPDHLAVYNISAKY